MPVSECQAQGVDPTRPMMDRPMGILGWAQTQEDHDRARLSSLLIIARSGSLSLGKRRQRRRDPIISFHCWFGSNLGEAEKQKRRRLSRVCTARVFISPPFVSRFPTVYFDRTRHCPTELPKSILFHGSSSLSALIRIVVHGSINPSIAVAIASRCAYKEE